jgi:lysine/ornithine N-monooxygenase
MTDYEYIFKQAKLSHYKGWGDTELRKCVDMLPNLSQEELKALFTCKWIKGAKTLKHEIFKILYMDRLGEREERFKEMSTNELINEFEDRSSGNISLIRQELRHRYKVDFGDDRIKIAAVFRNSTKGDQQWLELQMRRGSYGSHELPF